MGHATKAAANPAKPAPKSMAEAGPGKNGLSSAEVHPGMRVEGCLAGEYHEGVAVDVRAMGCFIRIS